MFPSLRTFSIFSSFGVIQLCENLLLFIALLPQLTECKHYHSSKSFEFIYLQGFNEAASIQDPLLLVPSTKHLSLQCIYCGRHPLV